ncbi:MAG: hypothetical protein ACQEXB_25750 [Bacillota bacterium]
MAVWRKNGDIFSLLKTVSKMRKTVAKIGIVEQDRAGYSYYKGVYLKNETIFEIKIKKRDNTWENNLARFLHLI